MSDRLTFKERIAALNATIDRIETDLAHIKTSRDYLLAEEAKHTHQYYKIRFPRFDWWLCECGLLTSTEPADGHGTDDR